MARQKKIFDVIFREKPVMMLISLLNSTTEMYASTLAKQVDCTYSHVVKILQEMNKSGLIAFNRKGRLKILTLTKKGTDVASNLESVRRAL